MRFHRRGIDSAGHVANYVETEQVLCTIRRKQCKRTEYIYDYKKTVQKYRVQIRTCMFTERQKETERHISREVGIAIQGYGHQRHGQKIQPDIRDRHT